MSDQTNLCYLVTKEENTGIRGSVSEVPLTDLPDGDVLIRVACSSVNYKDALAATGHSGVVRKFPHVPGIDAAGVVEQSSSRKFAAGDRVLATGYGIGADRWGGWSNWLRVPEDWVVRLPEELSSQEAMSLGTAGFTAAQCVSSLEAHYVLPDSGPVVVTGASGGVGCLAVAILAQLGYHVIAVTGKPESRQLLDDLGANEVIPRDHADDSSGKPLLATRWSGAVDTVGGTTLSTLIRSTQQRGCVAACGMVGGVDLPITVYPFILRGVTLDGIDSAACPMPERVAIWKKLAGPWRPRDLSALTTTIDLTGLDQAVQQILAGHNIGRTIVTPIN